MPVFEKSRYKINPTTTGGTLIIEFIIRRVAFLPTNLFNTKKDRSNLRILHITNFNERLDGRLFFNTGRRLNNGFIRQGHSVLGFSDRDIQKYYKSITDFKGAKTLNDKLKKTC